MRVPGSDIDTLRATIHRRRIPPPDWRGRVVAGVRNLAEAGSNDNCRDVEIWRLAFTPAPVELLRSHRQCSQPSVPAGTSVAPQCSPAERSRGNVTRTAMLAGPAFRGSVSRTANVGCTPKVR